MNWKKVGVIGVDAGLVWVGDPCYIIPNSEENPAKSWREFCGKLGKKYPTCKQFNYGMGHPGLGFCVSSGYGDGVYPVFVKKNEDGRIVGLKVLFVDEEEEE